MTTGFSMIARRNDEELARQNATLDKIRRQAKAVRVGACILGAACSTGLVFVASMPLLFCVVLATIAVVATSDAIRKATGMIQANDNVLNARAATASKSAPASVPGPALVAVPDVRRSFSGVNRKSVAVRMLQLVGGRRTSEQSPKG